MKKIITFMCCLFLLNVVSACAFAEDNQVILSSQPKNGELPLVATYINYAEFNAVDDDIAFMSNYRPLNLLSDKKAVTKASLLSNTKLVYNTNKHGDDKFPRRWEFIKSIY